MSCVVGDDLPIKRVLRALFFSVQVGYEYNVEVTGAWPSFVVNPQVFRVSTSDNMKVNHLLRS